MGTSLGILAPRWARTLRARRLSKSTERVYKLYLGDFVGHCGEDTCITQVTPEDAETWADKPRQCGGEYKPNSLNTRMKPIHGFFDWAVEIGLIDRSPSAHIKPAKVGYMEARGLSSEAVDAMLAGLSFRDQTILIVGLQLGIRRSEIARMRVEDWDRTQGVLYVIRKGGDEYKVPVAGEVAEAMAAWVRFGLGDPKAGPFWPSTKHKDESMSPSNVGRIVKAAADRAGVYATTHSLRHTCGTDLVMSGAPLTVAQAFLGHKTIRSTGRYATARVDDMRRWAEVREYRDAA